MKNISFVTLSLAFLVALTVLSTNCSSAKPTPPPTTQQTPQTATPPNTTRQSLRDPAAAPRDLDTFEYLADDGTPRTAWLEDVEVKIEAGIVVNTIDPDWRVKNPDGTTPRDKKIRVTATDGSARLVWVEANYNKGGDWVDCKFKNSKVDNSDVRDAQEDIWLLDRYRNPFRLTISRIWGGPPRTPKFFIG